MKYKEVLNRVTIIDAVEVDKLLRDNTSINTNTNNVNYIEFLAKELLLTELFIMKGSRRKS